MQVKKLKKKWLAVPLLLGLGFLALNPARLYAIFGVGDIVFDPSSYAAIGEIWSQDITTYAKIVEEVAQLVKVYDNAVQTYNLAFQMAQRVTNKNVWQVAAFAVGNEYARNHYNESVNLAAVMNGDVVNAGNAWNQATRDGGNAGYLGSVQAANSRRMAEYATLQLLDATSQRCGEILANYKGNQDLNQGAEDQLATDAFDESDAKNSMVAVLNVISGGHIHLRTQEKANGNLQACLAEQQTLQAKVKRDELADEQYWYSEIANARAVSSADLDPDHTAATVANYLIP